MVLGVAKKGINASTMAPKLLIPHFIHTFSEIFRANGWKLPKFDIIKGLSVAERRGLIHTYHSTNVYPVSFSLTHLLR